MYNSSTYCCNSCRKNPIFYNFLLKKKIQKKFVVRKKSKNQNWPIFDFSLIGSSVFELEPKTAKLRKQVELCPQGCFYLPTKEELFSRGVVRLTVKGELSWCSPAEPFIDSRQNKYFYYLSFSFSCFGSFQKSAPDESSRMSHQG